MRDRFLGTVDLIGTTYSDDHIATGYGNHLARPLMRERWHDSLTEGVRAAARAGGDGGTARAGVTRRRRVSCLVSRRRRGPSWRTACACSSTATAGR